MVGRMTPKEAIKCIDDVMDSTYNYDETIDYQLTSDDFDWLEKAKEALEKQIPKKPIIKPWSPATCPSCGEELSISLGDGYYKHGVHLTHCPNLKCLQQLDWSEGKNSNEA